MQDQCADLSSNPLETVLADVRARKELPPPRERRAIRRRAGLAAEAIAQALGVSRQTVSAWEHGRHVPRQPLLGQYAALLRDLEDEVAR
jgi:DNA-binding transcriptional regulator YiaG